MNILSCGFCKTDLVIWESKANLGVYFFKCPKCKIIYRVEVKLITKGGRDDID